MPWPSSYGSEFSRRHTWSHHLWKINQILFDRHVAKLDCSGNLWNICNMFHVWTYQQLIVASIEVKANWIWLKPDVAISIIKASIKNRCKISPSSLSPKKRPDIPKASHQPVLVIGTRLGTWLENARQWWGLSWHNGLYILLWIIYIIYIRFL